MYSRADSAAGGWREQIGYSLINMGVPDIVISKVSDEKSETTDIDRALELTDHRWFHWRLMIICGLAFLSTGFEFTLQGYIQPLAQCDLDLNAAKMSVITAVFLGGSLVSSLFWGIAADAVGRKRVLVIALTVEGMCTVIASWSYSSSVFAAIRCICGFMCGGAATVLLSYVGEFCTDLKRPRNICLMGFAWTMSWMIMPGLAAVVTPLTWELDVGFVTYKSWRLFIALVGLPNIMAGILMFLYLPESPKYYLSHSMEKESLDVLRMMYAKNTGNAPETFPVTKLSIGNTSFDTDSLDSAESKKQQKNKSISALWFNMFAQMKMLLKPPLVWSTMLSSSVYICGMFAYYGLGLWLPELFNRFESFYKDFPNETATVCQLSSYKSNVTVQEDFSCDSSTIHVGVFTNTFLMGTACFVGNCLATFLAARMPARFICAIFLEISAVCVVGLYFVSTPWINTLLSAGFIGLTNAGLSVHNTCAINLFPTYVRGMGVCISFLFGRLSSVFGSLVFGQLIDEYCEIPIFLVAAIIMAGGIFSSLLPKSSQKAQE